MSADAQYLIDLAADMSGGEAAASQLADMAQGMDLVGGAAGTLQAASQRAESALEQTGAAASTAAQSLADAEAAYRQNEKGASRAAAAADKLQQRLEQAREKLKGLQNAGDGVKSSSIERASAKVQQLSQRQTEARSTADALASALKEEAQALDKVRADASSAAQAHERLENSANTLRGATDKIRGSARAAAEANKGQQDAAGELASGLNALGGPLGETGGRAAEVTEAFHRLYGQLGSAGPFVLAAVAITALAVALAAAAIAAAKFALKMADAARSSAIATEALVAQHKELKGLEKVLPSVQRKTGLATEHLQDLAKQLATAGVKQADLPAALEAVAIAEAALGKGGAAELVEQLKSGKKTAAELAAEMNKKFGGVVAKKMKSLDSISERFGRNLQDIFKNVDLEPLLDALSRVVDLFDTSTASGRVLQKVLGEAAQRLFTAFADAINGTVRLFLKLEIAMLKIAITTKPLIDAFERMNSVDFSGLRAELAVTQAQTHGLGTSSVSAAGRMDSSIGGTIDGLLSKGGALGELGVALIDGLVAGITSSASKVVGAITGVVGDGISAAKQLLGIASPSKVFAKMGEQSAEGLEVGAKKGKRKAQSALESLVAPPASAPASPGGSVRGVSLDGVTFNLFGVKDADEAAAKVRRVLLEVLEGDVASLGGEAAPA